MHFDVQLVYLHFVDIADSTEQVKTGIFNYWQTSPGSLYFVLGRCRRSPGGLCTGQLAVFCFYFENLVFSA
jgi:hypothetical protein